MTFHIPVNWQKIAAHSNISKMIFPKFPNLLMNPSNTNEILIFDTSDLAKTFAYNTSTKSYKLYSLPNWPKILFDECNAQLNSDRYRCIATNGFTSNALSIVGTLFLPNGHRVSFFAVLDTKTWTLQPLNISTHKKVKKLQYCKIFPNKITYGVQSTIISYKNYIVIMGGFAGL